MFNLDILETMMENDETWFVYENGNAMVISDCSLMDC
jgi:hypothetical protein